MLSRATILDRIFHTKNAEMSPELARHILSLDFPPSDHAKVTALSEKAQDGSLTSEETAELDEYLAASDVLAMLQSQARRSLARQNPAA